MQDAEVDEYALVHIRGSKLIPLDQLEARWGEIDWSEEVVFVCRSGACSRLTAQLETASGRDEFLEGSRGGVERYF